MKTFSDQHLHRREISRREMLKLSAGGLLALGLWPGALRAEGLGNSDDFTFIVVNDLHYLDDRCGAWFERVVKQMNANEPKAAFCLIVGDFAEHGTMEEMGAAKESFHALNCPSYGVIGNHDYAVPDDRKVYEELFPSRLNYRFEHAGWQFVALDSSEGRKAHGTNIQPDTLQWLDDTLPKLDKKRPTVVFTHFPLGPLTPYRPLNADAVLERFRDHNLQAVFNGHFHGFSERKIAEITLTTNRCCANSRQNHDGTKEKGYFVCRAKEGRVAREFVEVKPA